MKKCFINHLQKQPNPIKTEPYDYKVPENMGDKTFDDSFISTPNAETTQFN